MNFHNLKRRALQALCKKHKIPANLTNFDMAEKLTAHLAVNEKPLTQGRRSCLKGLDENVSENESDVENRPAKKVRFSPENEMIEFEKSEVRYFETRGRGRRKSVMLKDSAVTVTTSYNRVNEGVKELRRSRRGKLLEGSDVESKRGKRATKVDALRDNGIADSVVNAEVMEIRRSRRGKLLQGVVESRGKKTTKIDCLMDNGTVYDVENGEVKEVRRSRRGKLLDGSEVESKAGKRVTKVEALKDNCIVHDVLNGDVRVIRRSRRGKFIEGSDVLKGRLSVADDSPSVNLRNEEQMLVKKQPLSKKGLLDEERRGIEGAEKGFKKGCSKSGKEDDCEDVAGSREAGTEPACVQLEPVVRRSNRHVAKVDKVKLLSKNATKNENVTRGRSRSKIALEVKENAGVDDISTMVVVKDGSLVEGTRRRSRRNASKLECSTSVQSTDVITIVNNKKERKKRRQDTGLEGETAITCEGNYNERSSRQITRNTNRSGRVVPTEIEKITLKEKGRSTRTIIEVEDSSNAVIPAKPDAKAALIEAPIDTVCDNCISAELRASVSEFESTIPAESNFPIEGQGETFTYDERNEGDDSKTTSHIRTLLTAEKDCKDDNLEHVDDELDKQHGAVVESTSSEAHSTSLCTVIVGKVMLEDFKGKEREQPNLKEHNSSAPENSHTVIDACEIGNSYIVNDCHSEALQTTLVNDNESKQEEYTSTMHLMKTLKQREEVSPLEMNGSGPHYLSAAVRNFEHPEMSSFEDFKPDENANSKIAHENSEELWELKSPDAIGRSTTRIRQDGDVNCGEDIIYPSDMQGEVLVFTEPSGRAVETATEFNGSIYGSKSVKSSKSSLSLGLDGKAFKSVDLETRLEMSTQSAREKDRGIEPELDQEVHSATSSKHEEVAQLKLLDDALDCSLESEELNCSARTKFSAIRDKVDPGNGDFVAISDLEHSLRYDGSDDAARTKFSLIQDRDLPDDGDPIAACDVERVVLCLHAAGTQIVVSGEGTELEQSSSKSCPRTNSPPKSSPLLTHQFSGANTESEHCLLNDGNMPSKGYGIFSEVKIKEESVSSEVFFMMKTPSTGEDVEIEKCTMSMDKSLNAVADTLDDQPELMMEGIDKEIYDCELATFVEMHEAYFGQEEPMNLAKRNSNEVKSPHHLIDFTEDSREDPSVAFGSKLSASARANCQKEEALIDPVDSEKHSELRTQSSKRSNGVQRDSLTQANLNLEEGLILTKLTKSEEVAYLVDQHKTFEDHSLGDKTDSSVTHKLNLIQDHAVSGSDTVEIAELCGMISSPPHVATTQITEGRRRELEFSARKSSSMSSSPQKSNGVQRDSLTKENLNLEERLILTKYTKSEEVAHLMDQHKAFDDHSLGDKMETFVTHKLNLIQDHAISGSDTVEIAELCGMISSPSHVATMQITEGRRQELAFSARKSSSMSSSPQKSNGVQRDSSTETNLNLEEGLILTKLTKSEELSHLMDQHKAFDDHSLGDKTDSSVTHKLNLIQDNAISGSDTVEIDELCGMISSPPHVATTQITEGRRRELEFSARKSSSMSSSPQKSNSIFKFHSVGTKFKSKHCLVTDDNRQNQGHETFFDGGSKEETDSVPALSFIQAPPTSGNDGLGRSDILMDGRLNGVIEVVNNDPGSMSEGMEPKRNCFSDCKAAKEREIQENVHGEEGGPIEMVTGNTIEAEAVDSALEVDGRPLYAALTALQNSNCNEQVQTSELSFTEPVSIPNSLLVENASNNENKIGLVMMSISMRGEEGLHQFDAKSTEEEQEKEVSGHENCVDSDKDEEQGTTQENIFTNIFEKTYEDELKMLFGIPITSYENNTVQAPDSGALHDSISHVASAEDTDGFLLEEFDCILQQHNEQKIDDLKFQSKIDVGEETSKDGEHAESGVKVHALSLEVKITPPESKGDGSFSFDNTKDAEEARETSLATLFETQVNVPQLNPEEMVLHIQEPAASESSPSKHHLVFNESEVADLASAEILSPVTENLNSSTSPGQLTKVAESVPLVQPEAASVEEPIVHAGKTDAVDEEFDQGKVVDLVKDETKSIPGTAAHQCAANADGVAALEHNLVSNLKTDAIRSKTLGAVAGKSITSAAKYTTPKRKNARTILIHGTPTKLQMAAADMKENAPSSKLEKIGSLTSVRPAAKRSALKHLPWR